MVLKKPAIFVVAIFSMLLAVGLAACGGSDEPAPTVASAAVTTTDAASTAETAAAETVVDREAALAKYAVDHAGGPGAIFMGDVSQLVGPATIDGLGGVDGAVPLSALEQHMWIYESDYYQDLLEKANLANPTKLVSSGESIEIQHACISRRIAPCMIIENFWAPNLESRTDGQIKLVVTSFPELNLAGPDTLQLVSEGTLSMANIYGGYVAGAFPEIEVQSLWGIYPDWETMYLSLTSMHPELESMVLEETGGGRVVNHNWFTGNDQFFYSKKPLSTLEDFKGLKTRTHAAALSDWIEGMGADAQFIALSEVYTALDRGILDAGVTGAGLGLAQRWYEVSDYINGPLKSMISTTNVVNKDIWSEMPGDLQAIMIEEGAKSELEQLRLAAVQNLIATEKNIEAGMQIVEFSPELQDHSHNVAVIEHVVPGWIRRLGYPEKGDHAVSVFNSHVGPYVGLEIAADGSVKSVSITKGPHAK